MRNWLVIAVLLCLPVLVNAKVVGEEIAYQSDAVELKGYLAYDDEFQAKRPGVLVVHEWWGHNDYVRKRARMLAKLGYTALALDMYGNGKQADHPDEAGKFAGEVRKNMAEAERRFRAALAQLRIHPTVDPEKVAAIGYCFGGGIVLEMTRRGLDLDGVVSFHGSLSTSHPAKKGKVKAKLLVLNGDADPLTTPEQIKAFKQEMTEAGVDFTFIGYPGAKHAFTNPEADRLGEQFNMPLAYNPIADKQSLAVMQRFLEELFK